MIKIKTKADLEHLRNCREVSTAYYELVELYFKQLVDALCPPEEDSDLYNLENDGYIVVLDSRDDPHRLSSVGLPDGLANSFPGPEWSEYHELPDGTKVYQIAYMMDNDYVMFYYIWDQLWLNDPVIQQFLADQWAEDCFPNHEGSDI